MASSDLDRYLRDLVDLNGLHGSEMVELGMDLETITELAGLAPTVRVSLAKQGKLFDCWMAGQRWSEALGRRGVSVVDLNMPDPDDQVPPDFRRITEAERGGFEVDGGVIKRHVWLAIGAGLWLFDPTAHQFDGCGRATIDRYWIQKREGRISFKTWRDAELV